MSTADGGQIINLDKDAVFEAYDTSFGVKVICILAHLNHNVGFKDLLSAKDSIISIFVDWIRS